MYKHIAMSPPISPPPEGLPAAAEPPRLGQEYVYIYIYIDIVHIAHLSLSLHIYTYIITVITYYSVLCQIVVSYSIMAGQDCLPAAGEEAE